MNTETFRSAPACCADHTNGMGIIDKKTLSIALRRFDQIRKRRQITFHTKYAVSRDETETVRNTAIRVELLFQIAHICMLIDFPVDDFSPAKPCSVDDAGVIQPVAINHIPVLSGAKLLIDDRRKASFVRRESRRK